MAAIGSYDLEEVLGRGGMGVVWRAVHRPTGNVVALKTIEGAGAHSLEALRREVAALWRVSHPGVVRILDADLDAERPWYAMEYVRGETLRQRLAARRTLTPVSSAPTWTTLTGEPTDEVGPVVRAAVAPEDVVPALAPIPALCTTLAFLHGEGFVHRDLKPDNVLVRPDGRPVVMDFGLATRRRSGRDDLEVDLHVHGTVEYMAPEQAAGGEVDARADLYALGCMLFEIATGAPPFVGSARDVLRRKQREPPPLASAWQDVPEALDALIDALLARDPSRRLAWADDVARVLERELEVPNPPWAAPAPRPFVYRPRLVGRDEVVARLVDRAVGGGLVAVCGPPGVGRTRTAAHVGALLARRGGLVLGGTAVPGTPLGALAHPLRRLIERTTVRPDALAALRPIVPGASALEPLSPEGARRRAVAAVREVLAAAPRPLALILDDLHLADAVTAEWIAQVAASPTEGFAVVGTWSGDAPWAAERLEPLGADDVLAMVRDMLGGGEVPEAVRTALAGAAGRPLVAAEMLEASVAARALVRTPSGWAVRRALVAPRLRELVRERIHGLGPGSRRLLGVAAVLGQEVDPDVLARVADVDRADLDVLLRHRLLVDVGGTWRFEHAALHEAALEDVPDRAGVHARVAAALRGRAPLATVAAHLQAAGDPEAADVWAEAAREAFEHGAWPETERAARAALALGVDVRHLAARAALHQGRFDDARRVLGDDDGAAAAQIRVDLALRSGDLDAADALIADLVARTTGPDRDRARLAALTVAWRRGDLDGARQIGESVLAEAEPDVAADALEQLAGVERDQGRLPDAAARLEDAVRHRRSSGPRWKLAGALDTLGTTLLDRGEIHAADAAFGEALGLYRAVGDRLGEATVLVHLGVLARLAGHPGDAVDRLEAARALLREIGERPMLARTVFNLGVVLGSRGDLDGMRRCYDEAATLFEILGDRTGLAAAMAGIAGWAVDAGREPEGADAAERAWQEAQAIGFARLWHATLTNGLVIGARMGPEEAARWLSRATADPEPAMVPRRRAATAMARVTVGDLVGAAADLDAADPEHASPGDRAEVAAWIARARERLALARGEVEG